MRCCTMCTEYKYSSAMSCMGQSLDNHSKVIIKINMRFWRLGIT